MLGSRNSVEYKQSMANLTKANVFVYGTLKEGHGNHGRLNRSKKLGKCWLDGFLMVDLGAFPGAVEVDGFSIFGEVYECTWDTITESLDKLEGHPNFYQRVMVRSPRFGNVWVYTLPKSELKLISHYYPRGVWLPKSSIIQPEVWVDLKTAQEKRIMEKTTAPTIAQRIVHEAAASTEKVVADLPALPAPNTPPINQVNNPVIHNDTPDIGPGWEYA